MRLTPIVLLALAASACASAPPTTPPSAPPKEAPPKPAPAAGRAPASSLKTNTAGIAIIKESEALRLESYELGGVDFIGYGHMMKQGEADAITEAQAEALLKRDLGDCENAIGRGATTPVTSNEFSALVSLCYNIGTGNFGSSSTLRLLNQGDRPGAADAFLLWNKAGGVVLDRLVKRRKEERTLFLKS